MLSSSGSPTPYQLPTKAGGETATPRAAGAAPASGSDARNPNAAKHAIRKYRTGNRASSAVGTVGEIKLHHPMADKDIPLRVHANAPFRVGQHEDPIIRFRSGGTAVDPVCLDVFDIIPDRPRARFRLIADEIAI